MRASLKKAACSVLLVSLLAVFLTGCWDNRGLERTFIITGVSLDAAQDPDQVTLTLQIGDTQQSESKSGESSTAENKAIVLKTTSGTAAQGIARLSQDSNHTLLMHHNQVLLFGEELAKQGVNTHLDLFMRNQQSRVDVPLLVVEGAAGQALSAKLKQEEVSAAFFAGLSSDLGEISPEYQTRLLDFATRLLDKITAPVAPIVKVEGEEQEQEIKMTGMAVFHGGKMVGRLDLDEVLGYIWAMGDVKKSCLEAGDDSGQATFNIIEQKCKREVSLLPDGKVRVDLNLRSKLEINELRGFQNTKLGELAPHLIELAQKETVDKILGSFQAARRLDADIFGFGASVYRKYPKEWKTMQDQWEEAFQNIDLNIRAEAWIKGAGQIVQSLEMEAAVQ